MASKLKTLDRIRKAEREVQESKARAGEERERLLREAKREALNLEDDLRKGTEAAAREILTTARERIKVKRESILAQGQGEAEAVKEAARAHIAAAVQQLLVRFEEAIRAQG